MNDLTGLLSAEAERRLRENRAKRNHPTSPDEPPHAAGPTVRQPCHLASRCRLRNFKTGFLLATVTLAVFAWALKTRDLVEARNLAFSVVLVERILAEYQEMLGLALTLDQARRLWGCDAETSRQIADVLVNRHAVAWSQDARRLIRPA